jgi:hypothetical protein
MTKLQRFFWKPRLLKWRGIISLWTTKPPDDNACYTYKAEVLDGKWRVTLPYPLRTTKSLLHPEEPLSFESLKDAQIFCEGIERGNPQAKDFKPCRCQDAVSPVLQPIKLEDLA